MLGDTYPITDNPKEHAVDPSATYITTQRLNRFGINFPMIAVHFAARVDLPSEEKRGGVA